LESISRAFEHVATESMTGDYYEFGLYSGGSFQHAQREAKRLGLSKTRFWGFDSFQGLPEVTDADRAVGFSTGAYACDRATVERLLNQWEFDWSCAELIEGWYEDSLTPTLAAEKGMRPAAIVTVDCDIYKSTVPVMRFMTPLIQPGTVIIFDDWYCFKERDGERKAFGEFIGAHPEWLAEYLPSFGWSDQSFVIRKRA
jgi:hypothetical protein